MTEHPTLTLLLSSTLLFTPDIPFLHSSIFNDDITITFNLSHAFQSANYIIFYKGTKNIFADTVFTRVNHALFNQNFVSKFRVRDLCEETILRWFIMKLKCDNQ